MLSDRRIQEPAVNVSNEVFYAPKDNEFGLAGVGEAIEFTLWTSNAGNVDLHTVEISEDGESHPPCFCFHSTH